MRLSKMSNPFDKLSASQFGRLLTAGSVRTRIVVLALIPVVGFIANGFSYVSGENDVGTAFETVAQSRTLADASRNFKIAIGTMRIAVKDFTDRPHTLIDSFGQSQQLANNSLDIIEASIGGMRADTIKTLRASSTGSKPISTRWSRSSASSAIPNRKACENNYGMPATRSRARSTKT